MWKTLLFVVIILIAFQNFILNDSGIILPEFPLINVDTRVIQKNPANHDLYETTTPHLPAHDLTHDGRIALRRRGSPNGGGPLFVLKPERVKNFIGHGSNPKLGAGMMDNLPNATYVTTDLLPFLTAKNNSYRYKSERTIICEKTESHFNPTACGTNKDNDCYKITFVTRIKGTHKSNGDEISHFVARDATVTVSNPKTTNATITQISVNNASIKIGPILRYPKLAEPVIVGDSRLMILRLGDANSTKASRKDSKSPDIYLTTGKKAGPGINIVYTTYPTEEDGSPTEQCDVERWSHENMHPISHAFFDNVNGHPVSGSSLRPLSNRYKFARYRLRDSLGYPFKNGDDIGATYQWMDKDAANLLFTTMGPDTFYNFKTRGSRSVLITPYKESEDTSYQYPLLPEDIDHFEEANAQTSGISIAGFWTHGKTVILDGMLNNIDYNFRVADRIPLGIQVERKIQLYSSTSDLPVDQQYEPISGGRELGNAFSGSQYHHNLTTNTSFLGSLENRFFFNQGKAEAAFPATLRDIVWHIGSTKHTAEVALDDYINPHFYINADMTAALGQPIRNRMSYFDGIYRGEKKNNPSIIPDTASLPDGLLLFHNGSTAPEEFMKVPRFGVPIGSLRMEPLAKGGIYGKGVWFNGESGIAFPPRLQTGSSYPISTKPVYISVFIDPREQDQYKKERLLFSLSNKDEVYLAKDSNHDAIKDVAYSSVLFKRNGTLISKMSLPGALRIFNKQWSHIAIQFRYGGKEKTLFIDGYPVGTFSPLSVEHSKAFNQFFKFDGTGSVFLGQNSLSSAPAVRGWLDEFKVLMRFPSLEEVCNYARGTLINIDNVATSHLSARQKAFPESSHQPLINHPIVKGSKFACHTRYNITAQKNLHPSSVFAHRKNLPPQSFSIREDILMRNKDLVYGKPRPNFSTNHFCLSCHVGSNPHKELNHQALVKLNIKAEKDSRRQPMQPPPAISGVIPAHYFGENQPATTLKLDKPVSVDQWLLRKDK